MFIPFHLHIIAKAMKKIHKEISQLVNGQEDHLGKVNIMQRKYLEMVKPSIHKLAHEWAESWSSLATISRTDIFLYFLFPFGSSRICESRSETMQS